MPHELRHVTSVYPAEHVGVSIIQIGSFVPEILQKVGIFTSPAMIPRVPETSAITVAS